MALRVLLIGATGTIGGAVLETLIKKGHEVTILVRDEAKGRLLVANNGSLCKFVAFEMTTTSAPALKQLAKAFDCIVYAAYTSAEVEVAAVRAFLEGGLEAASEGNRAHFVFTSDCLVYGDHGEELITENSSTAGCLPISQHRIALEQEILSAANALLTTTVVRPSWVYPASGVGEYIEKAQQLQQLIVPQVNRCLPFVHVEDLADLYARVLEQRTAGVLNAAEPGEVTAHQWAQLLADRLRGVEVRFVQDPLAHREEAGDFMLALSVSQRIRSRAVAELGWQPRSILSILPKLL